MPLPASDLISIDIEEDFNFRRPDPTVSNLKNIFGGQKQLKLPNGKKVLRNFLNSGLKTFKSASQQNWEES